MIDSTHSYWSSSTRRPFSISFESPLVSLLSASFIILICDNTIHPKRYLLRKSRNVTIYQKPSPWHFHVPRMIFLKSTQRRQLPIGQLQLAVTFKNLDTVFLIHYTINLYVAVVGDERRLFSPLDEKHELTNGCWI